MLFSICDAPIVREWLKTRSVSRVGGAHFSARVSRGAILRVRSGRECALVTIPGAPDFDATVQPAKPYHGFAFFDNRMCRELRVGRHVICPPFRHTILDSPGQTKVAQFWTKCRLKKRPSVDLKIIHISEISASSAFEWCISLSLSFQNPSNEP